MLSSVKRPKNGAKREHNPQFPSEISSSPRSCGVHSRISTIKQAVLM